MVARDRNQSAGWRAGAGDNGRGARLSTADFSTSPPTSQLSVVTTAADVAGLAAIRARRCAARARYYARLAKRHQDLARALGGGR